MTDTKTSATKKASAAAKKTATTTPAAPKAEVYLSLLFLILHLSLSLFKIIRKLI